MIKWPRILSALAHVMTWFLFSAKPLLNSADLSLMRPSITHLHEFTINIQKKSWNTIEYFVSEIVDIFNELTDWHVLLSSRSNTPPSRGGSVSGRYSRGSMYILFLVKMKPFHAPFHQGWRGIAAAPCSLCLCVFVIKPKLWYQRLSARLW